MGIKSLSKFLAEHAPGAAKDVVMENYFGRKIAVDASMHIYQFMMVVGRQGDQMLTNEAGEVTSHLQGMFYRTIRMLEAGLKPIYVFDGAPPDMKKAELAKRGAKRGDAEEALTAAVEAGKTEDIEKYSKRSVRVTKVHNEECMRLLRLMGVPILQAPGEAEAQCAALTRDGLAFSVSTEDMDALPLGAVRLSRNLMAPASADKQVVEYDLQQVLTGLELTMDQFIDFCILCGCDYCDTIRNVGPVTALKLIKTHKNLEGVIASLDPVKFPIPEAWPFAEARKLFQNPTVESFAGREDAFKWTAPDEEGLVQFLVNEKQFQEERVRSGCKKMRDAKGKGNQGRIESFFKVMPVDPEKAAEKAAQAKRKAPEPVKGGKGGKGGAAAKKGKAGGGGGGGKGGKGK